MKDPRGSLGTVLTHTGRIYSIAGSGVKSNLNSCEYLDTNEPFERQEWKYGPSLEVPRHAVASTFSLETKKIYCVGGWKFGTTSCSSLDSLIVNATHNATSITPESSPTLEERKPLTENEWRACPRLPTARKLHGVCSKNSKI